MANHKIRYGSLTIDYSLIYRERKSLGIKVYPDCSVEISAPHFTHSEKIESKIRQKAAWILKQQNEFLSYHPLTPDRLFLSGETHLYLGRQYKLRIEPSHTNDVRLLKGCLIISVKPEVKPKVLLEDWYRQKAVKHFTETVNNVLPLFAKYKILIPELQIRIMNKRWGSCTPNGKIILNPELIKAPKGSIEYVVIHELCHLVYHNHTKAFYTLQEKMMPDWKKWKEKLEYSLV
jgi:predicted metal-dependent hydrolase